MLSERVRNSIVGLTILFALALLMWGIFVLGMLPAIGRTRPYAVTLIAYDANGISSGGKVDLNGVNIGQVTNVYTTVDAEQRVVAHVIIDVDGNTNIPASAQAFLGRPTAGIGNAFVSILVGKMTPPLLAHDGSAQLPATPADSSLIPKVLTDQFTALQTNISGLTVELSMVAKDLHGLLAYSPPDDAALAQPGNGTNPAAPRPTENISTIVIRLNRTVASIQRLLDDPALQSNIRTIVQNLSEASAQLKVTLNNVNATLASANATVGSINQAATRASTTLDTTQVQIVKVSEKLVDVLDAVNTMTREITQGKGTAGKLISDDRLYEGLIDLSTSLKSTVNDLDFLLKKWKDEGVNFNLK